MFSFLEWELHHIHLLAIDLDPEDIKHLIAQLHIALIIGQGHDLIHPERHHSQCLPFQYDHLPIQNTGIGLDVFGQQIDDLLVHVAVVDAVSGEKLDLRAIVVSLDSLAVVFGFNKVRVGLVLEEVYVTLACQHGPDWVE